MTSSALYVTLFEGEGGIKSSYNVGKFERLV